METSSNNQKNNRGIIYILASLLFISIIGNIIQWRRTSHVQSELADETESLDSLSGFKDQLQKQFDLMTGEFDDLKGKNVELDSLLQKANTDLEKQKRKIEKLIKENKDIPLLQRQLAEMKAIRDQYRVQIEQLIRENKDLRYANLSLTQEVDNLNKVKDDLSQKVDLASVLKAENIAVKTLREKGRGAFEASEKARRVSRISISLVLAENKLAKPGNRQVILRIIKPDGYVMTDFNSGSGNFTNEDGRNVEFTQKKSFNYFNQREEIVFDWDPLDELRSGLYIAEIYLDGKLLGNNKFNLK